MKGIFKGKFIEKKPYNHRNIAQKAWDHVGKLIALRKKNKALGLHPGRAARVSPFDSENGGRLALTTNMVPSSKG